MEQIPAQSVQRQTLQQGQTTDDGSITSSPEINSSICQQQDDERTWPELNLPEDLLYYVHALMPMRDAARAAGVSHGFLRSWGFFPNLILDIDTLGIEDDDSKIEEITTDFITRVDHIMRNHSGTGVKIFRLRTYPCNSVHPSYIDRWLQVAITPGIEEFELMPLENKIEYNFPCLLLSTERGSSLQSFFLYDCAFHPTLEVGCLSSLKCLHLGSVHITDEELCAFLSKSLALEELVLFNCSDIIRLKIPSVLLQLNFLHVQGSIMLELIESDAPNLSKFIYVGRPIHISLGYPSQLRHIHIMSCSESSMLYWGRTNLPSVAPNLQTLYLSSSFEVVNTPMVLAKFMHLKYLEIMLTEPDRSPDYDFCSLASFLDGSPSLDTFVLRVDFLAIIHDSILEYSDYSSLHPRCLPHHRYDNLKNVLITGFCSAKSMVELINHILGNAPALECLTLDASRGHEREIHKTIICMHMYGELLIEVPRACLAFSRYVEGNVPSTVNLRFIEPCNKCLSYKAPK